MEPVPTGGRLDLVLGEHGIEVRAGVGCGVGEGVL